MSHQNDRSQTDPPARADADDVADAALQKRTIADFYSRVAAAYDAVGPVVFARFGEHVVVLAGIGAGAQVLDVAAGRGAIAEQGLTNATMLHMDAEALDVADASFDVVLCSFAYFLFPHVDRALAECARVLRAGGTLLLTTHGLADEHWKWYEEKLVATYARHGLPWPYTVGGGHRRLDELEVLLAGAGLTDLRQAPVEVEAVYATGEQWWAAKWTHGARRALESLPPDILQELVTEVTPRLADLRQTDGFHERWRIVCLLGTKPAT
jgi:SAM-dependent methyltransferase